VDIVKEFASVVEVTVLDDKAADEQLQEIKDETDWRVLLDSTLSKEGFKYKNTVRNLVLILTNEIRPDVIRYDSFANRGFYSVDTPWAKAGEGITDEHMIDIKMWVRDHFGYEATKDKVYEAVSRLQSTNKFHPVRDYLDALEWDGVARANFWLRDFAGAADNRYTRDVSRKILVAMVARAYKAGTKFDYVPILEGKQGARKSTLIAALAGHSWFTDQEFNIKDKDAVSTLQGHWVVELGELSSIRKADLESLKSFISRTEDKVRMPYGRLVCVYPRQGVFIGSTNQNEFLQDDSGNRRFWPISVGECDPEGLTKVRDQLFAEAVMFYEMGERLYLDNEESQEISKQEQRNKLVQDSWTERVEEILQNEAKKEPEKRVLNPARFSTKEMKQFEPFVGLPESTTHDRRLHVVIRKIGYRNKVLKENGRYVRMWEKEGA
jgi:putative DNA primase/helicase